MIAVIPARGGSKGLPGKNIRMLAGKPLIVHTLECARAASSITRVIVTTDDEDIAAAARSVEGVEVPFRRPAELASDTAQAFDVYLHVADWLRENEGNAPETLCPLLPTAPLRAPADIDGCVSLYRARDADVVLSVTAAKPASWQQQMAEDGRMGPVPGLATSVENRQAYGKIVIPNGAVYVLNVEAVRRTRTYFGPRSYAYPMPADRSIDIDGHDDFRMAEALLMMRSAAA